MFCRSFPKSSAHALLLLGALLFCATAGAAPRTILPFTADTWRELERSPARPLAVVFSATDCAHCPAAIDGLAQAIRQAHSGARLVVVVMDGAGQEAALRQDRHYRDANRLYAFAGEAMALRYSVNPGWSGLTPYVALIPARGETRFHAGPPPPELVQAFLRP